MEKKIFFNNTLDKILLCGILTFPKEKTDKCIIFSHGITVDKEEDGIFTELARKLSEAGFAVFRFDFRGHGESEDNSVNMTITGEMKDLEGAVRLLQTNGYKKFGILGASFGGGAVSLFNQGHPELVKALVLWNAVIDYSENINPTLPWTKKYWGKPAFERAEKFGFTEIGSRKFRIGKGLMEEIKVLKPFRQLLNLEIPMLFVHGDKDTYVPVTDSVKYASLMKNAELKIISGANHGFHDVPKHAKQADRVTVEFFLKNM